VQRTRIVRKYVHRSIAGSDADYAEHRSRARTFAEKRLREINVRYGFSYNRVTIKNQKTRWGSCSQKQNINIHYRVVHLRPELADYVLTHELCHLKEMNHSRAFWKLVAETMPHYQELRAELKSI
jgi:predicted metal-dependent hydrolase